MAHTANRALQKLRAGQATFGTLSLIPEPSLPELAGAVGLDFFVIDTEHAAADERTVQNLIRAAQAAGVTPIVRARWVEEKTLLWILDSGAQGLMLPLIEDEESARRAFRLSRYPPEGERTLCSATRAAGHGAYRADFGRFLSHVNAEMLLIGLLETPKGVANARAIARAGFDVLIVGRADLSLKVCGRYAPADPQIVEITQRTLREVMAEGKTAGVLAYDIEDAKRWIDFGCKFIIYSQPELLLAAHYAEALRAMAAHTKEPR
jgi:2-keto-3-deoxy-L-rhamnonate aldolase RhmA